MTTHALCAKAIRVELKKNFPATKFQVRSDSFAGGNSVRIDYIDGVASSKVEELLSKYQYGHFNGMIDLYECSNSRKDIPQVKYVQVSRRFSDEVRAKIKRQLVQDFGIKNEIDEQEWKRATGYWSEIAIYREVRNKDF